MVGIPFWGVAVNSPPIFRASFSGDWDVHWGYGILTHGQIGSTGLDKCLKPLTGTPICFSCLPFGSRVLSGFSGGSKRSFKY